MTQAKTIAVLTGGGDVPGLNPCIKTLVYRAVESGMRVLGVKRGWAGLLHYNRDDPESFDSNLQWLNKNMVRTIDRTGGTYLHTSRTNPSAVTPHEAPEFLKFPTCSFFFASPLTIGLPRRANFLRRWLMYSNCRSRTFGGGGFLFPDSTFL